MTTQATTRSKGSCVLGGLGVNERRIMPPQHSQVFSPQGTDKSAQIGISIFSLSEHSLHNIRIFIAFVLFALLMSGEPIKCGAASVTIGTEAAVPLLSSQVFFAQQGFQPADGSVQTLNPPLFRWPYDENPYVYAENIDPRTFLFQLSTNAGATFASTQWSITTSNNFFNRIPAITNADGSQFLGTNYWRIIYMLSNAVTVVSTSAVHNFTLSQTAGDGTATNWDRSMLADSNYLYSALSPHPHMWFWATNRDAASTFMKTNYPGNGDFSWIGISNQAVQAVTNGWFTNETTFTNIGSPAAFNKAYQLWEVGLVYQLSTNAYLASFHPENFLDAYDRFWISQGYDRQSTYGGSDYAQDQYWAMAIDYLWPLMNSTQRSNAVYAIEQSVKFYTYEDWWYEGSAADPTRVYPQSGWKVNSDAAPKGGDSHQRYDAAVSLTMCLALWAESTNLQALMPYSLDFYLGKKDPYEGDEGRGYNQAGNLVEPHGGLGADILSTVLFQKAQLWLNPLYAQTVDQYSYMQPVYYHGLLEPWGDLDYGAGPNDTLFYNQYHSGLEMAMVTQNGAAVRHFNRQNPTGFAEGGGNPPFEAFIGYYYSIPAETNWPSTAYIDPLRGYGAMGSLQPNDFGAFTNGVSDVFQARPDAHVNHGMYGDGGSDISAYGAKVTAGGWESYEKHPMFVSGAVMVDGIGISVPRSDPVEKTYSFFTAFTNSSDFTYLASDTTGAYNRSNYVFWQPEGNFVWPFYSYSTNKRPYLVSMERRKLFPHKKYLVFYETMKTTQAAQFQFIWHYMEPTGVITTNGSILTYTCTNFFHGSNVTVTLVPFAGVSDLGFTNLTFDTNILTLMGSDLNTAANGSYGWNTKYHWNGVSQYTNGSYYIFTNGAYAVLSNNTRVVMTNSSFTGFWSTNGSFVGGTVVGYSEVLHYGCVNPFTGEDYSGSAQNPAVPEPLPSGNMWWFNKTPSTANAFGFVVYIQRWDEPNPTITVIDDHTVKVVGYTNDNSAYPGNWGQFTDTNTFGTNYPGAFSFRVLTASGSSGGGGGSSAVHVGTMRMGR